MARYSHLVGAMADNGPTVLLVEDEVSLRRAYERYLTRAGYAVRSAGDLAEARAALESGGVDIAFVDFALPDGTGDELIEWATTHNRIQSAYCVTASADCQTAVQVTRAGCIDILEKPIQLNRLTALVEQHTAGYEQDFGTWRRRAAPEIVGEDDRLVDVLEVVQAVADSDATVLVTGESGTGKELMARAVHNGSPRREGPFVALNCAAIPDSLIEAELFGHARGAFTGAVAAREGRIASAHGGTLFLDEIGDMPLSAQAKLLRMLQDRTISPIGSDREVSIDVRIVAATNRDLEKMVADGEFRADLYYRLSVIPVHLPPLRERKSDIRLLAERFIRLANERNGRNVTGFEASAIKSLESRTWPGNIRELMHTIERAVLLKRAGQLRASDFDRLARVSQPTAAKSSGSGLAEMSEEGLDLRSAMDKVERSLIAQALEKTSGNRTEAAALLGLNRTTLVEKIRKHNAA